MKSRIKKLIKRQDGQIFLIALVLLAIGGLMLPPLLSFMGTGIKVSELHEEEMLSLYAADAGIEDALYLLRQTNPEDIPSGNITGNITNINGNYVDYTIETKIIGEDTRRYRIISNATDNHDGSVTTIEVVVQVTEIYSSYGVLALDGPIVLGGSLDLGTASGFPVNIHANGNIISGNAQEVSGNVTATGNITKVDALPPYEEHDNVNYEVTVGIDTSDSSTYYTVTHAANATVYNDLTISGNMTIGPALVNGDLTINGGNVTLADHVWVTGDMKLQPNTVIISTANVSEDTPIEDMNAIIAQGQIRSTTENIIIGSDGNYPLLISLYVGDPAIAFNGGIFIGAILYAPYGEINIKGSPDIEGAAIGRSVDINGNYSATYPFPAQQDDNKRELDILSYIIK